MSDRYRLAVDVGGTFTDVVLEGGGRRVGTKTPTTRAAPEDGVIAGITAILAETGIPSGDVSLLIHGTTLATNALIERKGAVTALVTTDGFRDVLEIGYETRHDQYDIMVDKTVPLVPRERRFTVPERVDYRGRVLDPLDQDAVTVLVPELKRCGAESVAVGFLHAYANPDHELRAGALIGTALPGVPVVLSHDVCPEIREYERLSTTCANAYVRPLMERYLVALRDRVRAMGLECPLLFMTSGGALTTIETAARCPVRLVESGPAGGAIFAAGLATEMGLDKVISFDMGGTTAKICLIEDGTPTNAREFEVDRSSRFLKGSGLPLRIPVVEMIEIGAGGGSIARVDSLDRIAIGPDSAGADPGPAAYDRGGTEPTVTDGDVVLGRIVPDHFAGGSMPLSEEKAAHAVARGVGGPLDLETPVAAHGIAEVVDETMANAARVHAAERGRSAGEHALVVFGGAAPLHACRLAAKLGIERIVVPAHAGVGSAVGFLQAPIAFEVVRSMAVPMSEFDGKAVDDLFADMHGEALSVVRAGAPEGDLEERRLVYMRYRGQGHEVAVSLPGGSVAAHGRDVLEAAFEDVYRQLYGRVIPGAEAEALTWGLTLSTVPAPPAPVARIKARSKAAAEESRQVFDGHAGTWRTVPVYHRDGLAEGAEAEGPALIVEAQTSTWVAPGFTAWRAANGALVLERTGKA